MLQRSLRPARLLASCSAARSPRASTFNVGARTRLQWARSSLHTSSRLSFPTTAEEKAGAQQSGDPPLPASDPPPPAPSNAVEDPLKKKVEAQEREIIDLKVRRRPQQPVRGCSPPTILRRTEADRFGVDRTSTSAPSPTSAICRSARSGTSARRGTSPSPSSPKTSSTAWTISIARCRPSRRRLYGPAMARQRSRTKTWSTCTMDLR